MVSCSCCFLISPFHATSSLRPWPAVSWRKLHTKESVYSMQHLQSTRSRIDITDNLHAIFAWSLYRACLCINRSSKILHLSFGSSFCHGSFALLTKTETYLRYVQMTNHCKITNSQTRSQFRSPFDTFHVRLTPPAPSPHWSCPSTASRVDLENVAHRRHACKYVSTISI